jgi:ADP-ribosylation factor related protein 1
MIVGMVMSNDELEGIPMVLLANKQDMEMSLKIYEIKEQFNHVFQKISARESKVMAISALKG